MPTGVLISSFLTHQNIEPLNLTEVNKPSLYDKPILRIPHYT